MRYLQFDIPLNVWRGKKDKNAIKYLALINVSYFSAIYIMPSHIKYHTPLHYSKC